MLGRPRYFVYGCALKRPVNIIVPGVKWPGVSKNTGPPEQRNYQQAAIMDQLRRQALPDRRKDLKLQIWGFCEWGNWSEITEGIWGMKGHQESKSAEVRLGAAGLKAGRLACLGFSFGDLGKWSLGVHTPAFLKSWVEKPIDFQRRGHHHLAISCF